MKMNHSFSDEPLTHGMHTLEYPRKRCKTKRIDTNHDD